MPEALCFDMYGTLCDTQAVTSALHEHVDAPAKLVDEIARLWRRRQLNYMFRVDMMDAYRPFTEVTRDALEYALEYYGHDLDDEAVADVLDAYDELDAFPDTLDALEAIGEAGVDAVVFSNGNHEMLDPVTENTGVADRVDGVVSADEVGTYKPAPAAYEHAAEQVGHDLADCWLVSSNNWDVVGALEAGMGAARVNRSNEPYDPIGREPNATVDSLSELADVVADAER